MENIVLLFVLRIRAAVIIITRGDIVLLAVADASYMLTYIDDVGDYGRQSDAGIFANSDFGKALSNNTLQISITPDYLLGTGDLANYCFIRDEAFPLKKSLQRPYPGKYTTTVSHEGVA